MCTHAHTYIYISFFFFLTNFRDWTRVKRRKGTIFLAYPRVVGELEFLALSKCISCAHVRHTPRAKVYCLPLFLPFPPHPFHHDHRCLHLRSSHTGLPHDPSHPTLRARVSLAPFNHATPSPPLPPLPPLYCLPRSLVGIILALGNYRWTGATRPPPRPNRILPPDDPHGLQFDSFRFLFFLQLQQLPTIFFFFLSFLSSKKRKETSVLEREQFSKNQA